MFQYKDLVVMLQKKKIKNGAADMLVGGQTASQNTFNRCDEGRGCLHE